MQSNMKYISEISSSTWKVFDDIILLMDPGLAPTHLNVQSHIIPILTGGLELVCNVFS